MKLNIKFILLVTLFNTAIILLSIPLINEQPILFIIVEIIVVIMVLLSVKLYRSLILPVNLITSGIENIKDKDFSSKLIPVKQKEMDQLIDVYNRMIDQLRKERTFQQEQNFFLDKLITASPSGIILLNLQNQITLINPAAKEILNHTFDENSDNSSFPLHKEVLKLNDGESVTIKYKGSKTLRIQKSHFIDKGSRFYFVILEELTNEIRESEKESYGKVIRMMSHEVNNSIGAINSIMQSFYNYKNHLPEEDASDYTNALDVAIERNNQLNKFTKNFANVVRLPEPKIKEEELDKLLEYIISFMTPFCNEKNIELKFYRADEKTIIKIDREQIEQVLVNIIKNSVDAIDKGGLIEIELKKSELIIADNGKGISQEEAQHIFKPFYSTKKNGQGVGLTLIREILTNHNFNFSLQTKNDKTEFIIEF